jgi:4-hydroxybenzoate polyprenyltransferase
MINLIREMIKDIEDIKGDDHQGMRTPPIVVVAAHETYITGQLSLVTK